MLTTFAPALMATCERGLSAAMAAEPVNVLTAFACLAVAALALRLWRAGGGRDRGGLALVLATAGIGLGWPLAHLGWPALAVVAELLPVLLVGLIAFALVLHRVLEASPLQVIAACSALLAALGLVLGALGPLAAAVVPLFALYCLAATLILRARLGMHQDRELKGLAAARSDRRHFPHVKLGYALVQTGILIAIGIVVRAYDAALCGVAPVSLHALWHLLAALAVSALVFGILRHAPPQPGRALAGAEVCPVP
jgi:hypothetical protein